MLYIFFFFFLPDLRSFDMYKYSVYNPQTQFAIASENVPNQD
jgi:hypothetical protein